MKIIKILIKNEEVEIKAPPKKWYIDFVEGTRKFKCDTEGCYYTEDSIDNHYEKFLQRNCPYCGGPQYLIGII